MGSRGLGQNKSPENPLLQGLLQEVSGDVSFHSECKLAIRTHLHHHFFFLLQRQKLVSQLATPKLALCAKLQHQPTQRPWSARPPVTYKKKGGSVSMRFSAPSPPELAAFLQPISLANCDMHAASSMWM